MNYKETNLAGTSWTRCKSITITNPLAGESPLPGVIPVLKPIALFYEESITQLAEGTTFKRDLGYCSTEFNPVSTIALIDLDTGNPTGENITHAELYRILYSLYMQVALARDVVQ